MTKEEKFIEDKFGRRHPFRVPDDYFEGFTSKLMANLPDVADEHEARVMPLHPRRRRRGWGVAALGACAVMAGAIFYLGIGNKPADRPAGAEDQARQQAGDYSMVDAMADYAMMDTQDMYDFMAEADE